MESLTVSVYRHSGKFPIAAPLLAALVGTLVAFPLGFVYSYLVKWIPFVYLNFLLTLGYGFVIGMVTMVMLKVLKARNTAVAALTGLVAGLIALYFDWNGHAHALLDDAPVFFMPDQLWAFMKILNETGSWAVRSSDNVSGLPLAIVWVIEAGMIVGVCSITVYANIADTPFCETTMRWLDNDRVLDTLAPFTEAAKKTALKAGDLGPLLDAGPRTPPDADHFARLTLKSAPGVETFCTLKITNVTITRDKKGEAKESTEDVTGHLVLPASMLELVEKFASFESAPAVPSPAQPESVSG